jgi:hypothetical protein
MSAFHSLCAAEAKNTKGTGALPSSPECALYRLQLLRRNCRVPRAKDNLQMSPVFVELVSALGMGWQRKRTHK